MEKSIAEMQRSVGGIKMLLSENRLLQNFCYANKYTCIQFAIIIAWYYN